MQDDDLVAYFCAEFGLHESLPLYSGGLGILAGDHLKGARDARLPIVGIGIRWKYGYVEQELDPAGQPIIEVVKGGVPPGDPDAVHKVDAISGATVTSKSVQALLIYWLGDSGFGPYLERLRRQSGEES